MYVPGDMVSIGSKSYINILSTTSLLEAPGNTTYWTESSETGGVLWTADTDYKIGDVCTHNLKMYVCDTAHASVSGNATTGEPGIGTHWSSGEKSALWADGVYYHIGDQVWDNSRLPDPAAQYVCVTAHTSIAGGVNGEPQGLGTNWTAQIVEDPGTY